MQSKKHSFREACINTLVGFLITLLFSPLIYSMCGIKTSPSQLGLATFYFTIISVARSYIIRRWFNGLKPREKNKDKIPIPMVPIAIGIGTIGIKTKDKADAVSICEVHSYIKMSDSKHVCQFCGDEWEF